MQFYIGTKKIQAEPMENLNPSLLVPALLQRSDNVSTSGYKVIYPDGYESWSPKEVFEKAYLPMGEGNTNKITQEMVDAFIGGVETLTVGEKTTVVIATLVNDFVIVESSSCVDTENYNKDLGVEICIKRIKDKVWFLLGFLLQTAHSGIK